MVGLATTAIAWLLLAVIAIGWLVYLLLGLGSSRKAVGSEVELAANRKPYHSDEVLEGRRLELVQLLGVLLLIVIVVGLPLYWVLEPSRQAGANDAAVDEFTGWGAEYFETSANGGFDCAGCHGGMTATGGAREFALTDELTGEVRTVQWKAPALNTIFYRFSLEEVRFILTYGRTFSPMPAWGVEGGGPMNEQQIDTLLVYMMSIQVEPEGCDTAAGEEPVNMYVPDPDLDPEPVICESGHLPTDMQDEIDDEAEQAVADGTYATKGEALFNLQMASGAYSCARCHTQGWSYDDPGPAGQGAYGWNLTGGSEDAHFPDPQVMLDFVAGGSDEGAVYGRQGQGSGKMPGFGQMLRDDQIEAIVEYVRGL